MSDGLWLVLVLVLLAGVAANGILLLRLTRKVMWVHRGLQNQQEVIHQESARLFQQGQHAERLSALLRLDRPLPPMRGWAASPDFLYTVARHALAARPGLVVECGSGSSTVVLARALALNGSGRVVSLESDAGFAEATRGLLRDFGLEDRATVVHAPLKPVAAGGVRQPWYAVEHLPDGPIDLLIVDGPPMETAPLARYPAGPLLLPRMRPGGTVFVDDAHRPEEKAAVERWLNEVPGLARGQRHYCEKGCVELRTEAALPAAAPGARTGAARRPAAEKAREEVPA
jgi:predicted O-methyltransferase YrrM